MRYPASFTVEAAMVLCVVFLTMGAVIKRAYVIHDEVTGSMLLEEVLNHARYNRDEEKDAYFFERQGEQQGSPGLWLGAYDLEIDMDGSKAWGSVKASEWEMQMEMNKLEPETFLHKIETLKALKKEEAGIGDTGKEEAGKGQDDSGD